MLDTLEATTPAVTDARVDVALACSLGALFVGVVVAVDPSGLVPSGPARWTVLRDAHGCRGVLCCSGSRYASNE